MKSLEKALFELLKGFAGGRIYAMRAPQKAVSPFVVFQRTDSERMGRMLTGPSGLVQASMQIDVYASTYYGAKDLGAAIEMALDGFRDVVYYGPSNPQEFVRIAGISMQNDVDILDQTDEPVLFRSSGTYLITYEQ